MMANRIAELAALEALGALSDDERDELAMALASGDRSVLDELTSFRATVGVLADGSGGRSATLERVKRALLEEIDRAAVSPVPETRIVAVRSSEGSWLSHPQLEGAEYKELSRDSAGGRVTFLLRMAPEAELPFHAHSGAEECYLIEGELRVGDDLYSRGDFLHADAGTAHGDIRTPSGCTLLLVVPESDYFMS